MYQRVIFVFNLRVSIASFACREIFFYPCFLGSRIALGYTTKLRYTEQSMETQEKDLR